MITFIPVYCSCGFFTLHFGSCVQRHDTPILSGKIIHASNTVDAFVTILSHLVVCLSLLLRVVYFNAAAATSPSARLTLLISSMNIRRFDMYQTPEVVMSTNVIPASIIQGISMVAIGGSSILTYFTRLDLLCWVQINENTNCLTAYLSYLRMARL